jgi:hypothetical protein
MGDGFEVHEIWSQNVFGWFTCSDTCDRVEDASSSHTAATVTTQTVETAKSAKRSAPKHLRAKEKGSRRGRLGPWKAPLLLILAQVVVLGYLIRGSFFVADDYQAFGLAHLEGFGSTLLFTPGFGNLAPTERFLHWFVQSIAPMNYGLGEAIILALTAGMLVSLLWVLRELRADPAVVLTAIFIVGSSTIVLYEAFDFDQVTFLFPASAGMLCVTALFIRWVRTGGTWPLVGSWVVFGLSFFTQERVLILPIYLVVLRYLVLPYRMPFRGRRKPWADWRIWIPYGAIALAYYAHYRSLAEHQPPNYTTTWSFFQQGAELFLRALVGLPLQGVPGWVTSIEWLALLGVLVAVLIASRVRGRRKALLGATAFFLVAFGANLFAVFQGVGGNGIAGIVGQLQYYLDALLALAVAVGIATSPLPSASLPPKGMPIADSGERATRSLRWPVVVACGVVVALHIALLPFGMSNVLDSQGGQRLAASWVPTLRSSLSTANGARTPTTILPLTVPAAFVPSFEAPFQLEQSFLPLLPEFRATESGSVSIIGPTGQLQPARALNSVTLTGPQVTQHLGPSYLLSTHVDSAGDTCFTGKQPGGQFRVLLPQHVTGGQIAVDLRLAATRPVSMTPFAIGPPQWVNAVSVSVATGDQRVMVAMEGSNSASIVGFTELSGHSDFCVLGMQVAAVGVAAPRVDGQCREVDAYGSPVGAREPCGSKWQ